MITPDWLWYSIALIIPVFIVWIGYTLIHKSKWFQKGWEEVDKTQKDVFILLIIAVCAFFIGTTFCCIILLLH